MCMNRKRDVKVAHKEEIVAINYKILEIKLHIVNFIDRVKIPSWVSSEI